MNFNELQGNGDQNYQGHQQQQQQQHISMQQQQQQAHQQPQQNMDQNTNLYSMLPPQFQNLTPQQLQQLRLQPQFQTIMRNYLQRQQQLQQQQHQQGQPNQGQPMNTNMQMQQPQLQQIQQPPQQQMNPKMSQQMQLQQQLQQQRMQQLRQQQMNSQQNAPPLRGAQGNDNGAIQQLQLYQQQQQQQLAAQRVNPSINQAYIQRQQHQQQQGPLQGTGGVIGGQIPLPQQMHLQQQQRSRQPLLGQGQQSPPLMQQQAGNFLQQQQQLLQQQQQALAQGQIPHPQHQQPHPRQQIPQHQQQLPQQQQLQHFQQQQHPQQQQNPHQLQQQGPGQLQQGIRVGSIPGGPPQQVIPGQNQQIPHLLQGQVVPGQPALGKSVGGGPLVNGVPPVVQGPVHSAQSINTRQLTSSSFNEVIPQKNLSTLTEWSEKLKKEGEPVPTDVLVYESIIQKDTKFMGKMTNQLNSSKRLLDGLVQDIKSYTDIKQLRMNAIALSHKGHFNNSIWGEGYQGYGNGISNTFTRLILPKDLDKYTSQPFKAIVAAENLITDLQMNERIKEQEGKDNDLVPIRLEFDNERDRFKLRDTFLWNLNENCLSLESFVAVLIDDYKFIPPQSFENILGSIKEQIRDFKKKPQSTMGELRVPLKIDITINNTQLVDQFEWDIFNFEENDPEEFAVVLCDELKLPGEFTTAISHSIREQVQLFHKALYLIGYSFDGSIVHEDEIRSHILPQLRISTGGRRDGMGTLSDEFYSILRNPTSVADNTPTLIKLTQLELDRLDKEMEREARRKRRHNLTEEGGSMGGKELNGSGGSNGGSGRSGTSSRRAAALHGGARGAGSALPDLSDYPKTFRTPAPSSVLPGGVDLGVPDIYGYNEIAVQRTLIKNPEYKPPPVENRNNRVRYSHDTVNGRFIVNIKLR